jgi:hypothetical protein
MCLKAVTTQAAEGSCQGGHEFEVDQVKLRWSTWFKRDDGLSVAALSQARDRANNPNEAFLNYKTCVRFPLAMPSS